MKFKLIVWLIASSLTVSAMDWAPDHYERMHEESHLRNLRLDNKKNVCETQDCNLVQVYSSNGCYFPHAHSVHGALKLLASGFDPNSKEEDGRNSLYYISFADPQAADIALLMAGADPQGVDNKGLTPLMRVVHDIVQRQFVEFGSKEFRHALELAATLVKIGVPLDARSREKCGESYNCCAAGSDVFEMVQRCKLSGYWGREMFGHLEAVMNMAQCEVERTQKNAQEQGKKTLHAVLPLPRPVTSIVVEYASKDHVLPPSLLPRLKGLKQKINSFEQSQRCVVS